MNYLIDNSIIFNPEKKTISSRKNPEISIPLTTTATRLLDELVRKPNEVLSRTYLLKAVWEDHGYASSDASLNNNISLLRKNFSTVSEKEVDLKTVPKTGFQLNAIVQEEPNFSGSDSGTEHETSHAHSVTKPVKYNTITNPGSVILLLSVILIIASSVIYAVSNDSEIKFKKKPVNYVEQLGKCNVYNLSGTEKFSTVLEKYPFIKERCETESASVYYDFSDLSKERAKNLFVAICEQTASAGFQKCENIKSYSLQ